MTNTELARHIYHYSQNCKKEKASTTPWDEHDDRQVINYIANLMELHFDHKNHLGSRGFESINTKNSPNFGC